MAETAFFTFMRKIAKGKEQFPINILYGFNEFLGENIINSFCKTFLEGKSDFNFRRYYFDSEDGTGWEEIINEANSSSFFIESRKIIIATIREEKRITILKADKALLKKYIAKPNPNTILLIYFSLNATKDDFKQIKKLKIDKFVKELASPKTNCVNLDKISHGEFNDYIHHYLHELGITITASALDRIIEIKEDDYISVLHQLPKLAIADIQDKGIDSEDIDKIITGVEAHSIWDLTDSIENEDVAKYIKILNYLFMNGVTATLIIGTLITHYNKLYIGKFLLNHQMPTAEIGRALGQHSYFLNKFIQTARSFSDKRLDRVLDLIYKLDYESKTSGENVVRLSLQNFALRLKLMGQSPAR
ncbi:MAG: DNA polymerase III subunit delta [bacterium]|nr:DNA polymerase III subunit delta [bacterium]